jgi:hypothetical protein
VLQVAANDVQVLNSVNSKLPFLVTTSDDAKDSLKEEIRLRLVYLYLFRLDSHRGQNLNIFRVYWSFRIDVVVHVIYLANFISDLLLILVEMREFCVGPIVKFIIPYSYLYDYVSVWEIYCLQLLICRYRCLDLRRQQMNFNILLRHKVVKLMRRYLEDIHGFVEVLSQ